MKLIFLLMFLFSLKSFTSAIKLLMQHKIKSKEKNALINSGDRIEGRYQIIEKTNELTSQPMNEEWFLSFLV